MSKPVPESRCRSQTVRCVAAPLDVYAALYGGAGDSFLYESLQSHGGRGRYSFLGGRPRLVMRCRRGQVELIRGESREVVAADPFEALRRLARDAPPPAVVAPFASGAVGYLAYDAVRFVESVPDTNPDDLGAPDAYFVVPDEVIVFDHLEGVAHVCLYGAAATDARLAEVVAALPACARGDDFLAPATDVDEAEGPAVRSNQTREQFTAAVERAKEHIRAGDAFQVVLSQRFEFEAEGNPLRLYAALRRTNPSPYMYLLKFDGVGVLGSSPESLVSLRGRRVEVHPLAGTRPRGATPGADAAAEADLRADAKEAAEHLMLVDLGRNDAGRVCEFGSVRVSRLMAVERCPRVMHLVSDVEGRLRDGADAVDLLRATFPAGTVSGAPKVRAMQIIDDLEPTRRGVYAGAIGYLSATGDLDVCIAIRSIVLRGGRGYVQAGAGIVADSDPGREYQETLDKARGVLRAVALATRRPILVIDNYDSFVFNLVQCLGELGATPVVRRNDRITVAQARALDPAGIVISPGPGRPADAGISNALLREFDGPAPILGVCLGHQAIGETFGGRVSRAGTPVHGKTAAVLHDGRTIFAGLPSPLTAMRYHSLVVERAGLPECLEVSAWTADGLIMGLRHRTRPIEGVQFHPESVMTDAGKRLLQNFLRRCDVASH
jgi:anthranilate synthase component 1